MCQRGAEPVETVWRRSERLLDGHPPAKPTVFPSEFVPVRRPGRSDSNNAVRWGRMSRDGVAAHPARASSSRTSGVAGRLSVVSASSVCQWSRSLVAVRGRCCTSALCLMRLTLCLQTTGITSTRVHPRRSPSRSVYPRPSRSVPVAVLSCCTHHLGSAATRRHSAALRRRGSPVRPMVEPSWADPGTATGLDPTVATKPGTRHLLIFLFCQIAGVACAHAYALIGMIWGCLALTDRVIRQSGSGPDHPQP